jgi:hypothetical protein
MSVIACKCCRSIKSLARCTAGLFFLFVLCSTAAALQAQTIRIKLVNGRTGRAMAGTCVNVWVGNERKSAMAIPTDKDGVASLRLTDQDAEINTQNRWEGCGDFGVTDPVVKYATSIRVNAGYVLCQVRQPDHTWLATQSFPTKEVLESGIASANTCGKAKAVPTPGEVVLFVRPLSWWEKLKE